MIKPDEGSNGTPEAKRILLEKLLREKAKATKIIHPMSYNQSSLWFMQQLEPENAAYKLMGAWSIQTEVNIQALKRAFQGLINRHAILRTTYSIDAGKPVQEIHGYREIAFEIVDANEWSDLELKQWMNVEANRSIDLEDSHVLQVHLFLREAHRHVLMLSIHHIAIDGWSLAILLDEFQLLYHDEITGKKGSLSSLTRQYTHFVNWQANMLESKEGQEHQEYWLQQLAGEVPVLNLPTDRPRPLVQSSKGSSYNFKFSEDISRKLRLLARREGTTLYTVLLAAYKVLLHRYSGQDDFSVGSFTAGRSLAEYKDLIGYFVNPVVLRSDFSNQPSFKSYLNQVRLTVLDSIEHQDYPFSLLVDKLKIDRNRSQTPLFQVAFVLEQPQRLQGQLGSLFTGTEGAIELGGLMLEAIHLEQQAVQYDLTLMIEETQGPLCASIQYNTDLYDRTTIERMAGHYVCLLESIVEQPEKLVSRLQMITNYEWHQQVLVFNDTKQEYPQYLMHQMLEINAVKRPNAIACSYEKTHLTYKELNERANQLAHHLRQKGVDSDQLVGICIDRSLEMVVAVFGVLKSGGAYVPLDPSYPMDRLSYMLQDTQLKILLTTHCFVEKLSEYKEDLICLDTDWSEIELESRENLLANVSIHNLAYVIYTSGSTGRPKGVLIEHIGLWNMAEAQLRHFDLDENSRILQFASFSFDAWVFECVMAIRNGATLCLAPRHVMHGPSLLDLLYDRGITHATLPPSVLATLPNVYLPDLRTLIIAGEVCNPEIVSRWVPNRRVFNAYGPSEATVWVSVEECFISDNKPTIGRPIQNFQLYILDERLQPLPIGVPGELHIGGIGVARGYHNRAELTTDKFISNPFSEFPDERLYKTGDLACFRTDGKINFLGRIDHQIKWNGFRIELGEIESILNHHPNVKQSHLQLYEDQHGNNRLVAYTVLYKDQFITGANLRKYLRGMLPEFMVPSIVMLIEEMPISSNGKLDGQKLPVPEFSKVELDHNYMAPRNTLEEQLASLWSDVLGVERVGIFDSFFDLGGHSLLVMQLLVRVRNVMKVNVPIRVLFEKPTIELFAQAIHAEQSKLKNEQITIPEITREEYMEVSFAQQRMWFLDRMDHGNPAYHISGALRLKGRLQIEALYLSFQEIVRRHESLRTSFQMVQGQLKQKIATSYTQSIPLIDLQMLDEVEREMEMKRLLQEDTILPFHLEQGPLIRTSIMRLSNEDHVLSLTIHHIISDGWSMGLLLGELKVLYEGYSQGLTVTLPELAIQYADFAHWHNRWLKGDMLEEQVAYWKHHLDGELPILALPTDYRRPGIQSFKGARETLLLSEELSNRIKLLGQEEGTTLFMTLMTAFKILLYRHSGLEDIILGSPIAGRSHHEVEPIIGFFINTLVMRTDLSGKPSFREALARVREVALGAYAHQDLPFEKLVEIIKPPRDLSRPPLFQVMFNMLNLKENTIEFLDLHTEMIRPFEIGSKFDITLYAEDTSEGLFFELVYNKELFKSERIHEMLVQLRLLLQQIIANPDNSILKYSLVTESAQVLLPDPLQRLVAEEHDLVQAGFSRIAAYTPDRVAIIDGKTLWTYADLELKSNKLAHYLHANGVSPQDVVAVYGGRSASLVWALLGVLKAGATFTILDYSYPTKQLMDRVTVAAPRVLLCLQEARNCDLPSRIASISTVYTYKIQILHEEDVYASGCESAPLLVAASPEDAAYLNFTSGTTGLPKGIIGTHKPISHFLKWYIKTMNLQETDRFSMLSGLAHDPLIRDIFTPLSIGATICIPDQEKMLNSGYLHNWMKQEQISVVHLTPAISRILVGPSAEFGNALDKLYSLRLALFGGDILTERDAFNLMAISPNVTCVNVYGSTETPQVMGAYRLPNDIDKEVTNDTVPIGRGIDDVQLLLLNEQGMIAGIGEIGEIYIRTPYLAGYLEPTVHSQRSFILNPFTDDHRDRMYASGDYARYQLNGNVQIIGRRDDQVKLRGYRIELAEVQVALSSHEAVQDLVVHVSKDERGDKCLAAYVVLKQEGSTTSQELRQFATDLLPDYMIPSTFIMLNAIPLTANGKVNYHILSAMERKSRDPEAYIAPQGDLEQLIAEVWQEELQVPKVGMYDNFFDIGGHSLLMVAICSRLQELLQSEVSVVEMFKYPTVNSMAQHLEHRWLPVKPSSTFDHVHDRARKQKEALSKQNQLRRSNRHEQFFRT